MRLAAAASPSRPNERRSHQLPTRRWERARCRTYNSCGKPDPGIRGAFILIAHRAEPQAGFLQFAATVARVAADHGTEKIEIGPVVSMLLPVEGSHLLRKSHGVAHCFTVYGLAGLFRKDVADTRAFGRNHCDQVKTRFNCDGFFTTDELPKYGIGEEHRNYINTQMEADPGHDVTVITLYDRAKAADIRGWLSEQLTLMLSASPS
jgi:hypothetical protein